jgi:hypothetical protein
LLTRSQIKEQLSRLDQEKASVQVGGQANARISLSPVPPEVKWPDVPHSDPASSFERSPSLPWSETLSDESSRSENSTVAVETRPRLQSKPGWQKGQLRKWFLGLLIVAIFCIILDSILIFVNLNRRNSNDDGLANVPLILLSSNVVNRGERVTVHLLHCQPLSQIVLTRDLQETLSVGSSQHPIQINANGEAVVHISIDETWKIGSHRLHAEDSKTHYVVDSPLYVAGSDPLQPAHLRVNLSEVDLGAESQSKNSSHSLELSNSGNGMIYWQASSDQPWLKLTPMQGKFSQHQEIFISATRTQLNPGDYQGTITIASNAGNPLLIHVKMSVQSQIDNPGPLLSLASSAFAFSATDGGNDPGEQVLIMNNPGSRPLTWSLSKNSGIGAASGANWLQVEPTSGVIAPGTSASVRLLVHSQPLVEGVYLRMLTLAGEQTGSQSVAVALTVGRHCGVVPETNDLIFMSAVGQNVQPGQKLNLSTTAECSGNFPWRVFSLANWLSPAQAKGHLSAKAHDTLSVGINGRRLQAGTYHGLLVFATSQRTDMVLVQLTVSPALQSGLDQTASTPTPTTEKDITLRVAPANLTFAATQGQANLPGQSVTIVSMEEKTAFSWRVTSDADWLALTPLKGSVTAAQSAQMIVSANAAGVEAGTHVAHITVIPVDEAGKQSGKSQTVVVTLKVAPQCVLQVAPSKLTFSASFLSNPPAQTITLKGSGNCAYPVTWTVAVDAESRTWLSVSVNSGTESGSGNTITVSVNRKGMLLGSYSGNIVITAFDSNNAPIQGGAQVVTVALNVFG